MHRQLLCLLHSRGPWALLSKDALRLKCASSWPLLLGLLFPRLHAVLFSQCLLLHFRTRMSPGGPRCFSVGCVLLRLLRPPASALRS